jgi:hypothetical protein
VAHYRAMCFIIALTLYNRTNHCNIRNYFISVPSMLIVSDIMFEPNYNKITESARKSLLFFHQKLPNIALATRMGDINNNLKHHKWFIATSKLSNLSFHFFQRVDVDPSACSLNGGNCGNDAIGIVFCNVFLLISFSHRRMGF